MPETIQLGIRLLLLIMLLLVYMNSIKIKRKSALFTFPCCMGFGVFFLCRIVCLNNIVFIDVYSLSIYKKTRMSIKKIWVFNCFQYACYLVLSSKEPFLSTSEGGNTMNKQHEQRDTFNVISYSHVCRVGTCISFHACDKTSVSKISQLGWSKNKNSLVYYQSALFVAGHKMKRQPSWKHVLAVIRTLCLSRVFQFCLHFQTSFCEVRVECNAALCLWSVFKPQDKIIFGVWIYVDFLYYLTSDEINSKYKCGKQNAMQMRQLWLSI